jgi:hypothetical protein
MAEDEPRFATVSTSTLQIKIRVPSSRSPSPSPCRIHEMAERPVASRSTSVRHSRLDSRPPTSNTALACLAAPVRSYKTSRSLSPRPQRSSTTLRPPPPSPSGLLPTRAPTPPRDWAHSLRSCEGTTSSAPSTPCQPRRLEVPRFGGGGSRLLPRSISPRCVNNLRNLFKNLGNVMQSSLWSVSISQKKILKIQIQISNFKPIATMQLCNFTFCKKD